MSDDVLFEDAKRRVRITRTAAKIGAASYPVNGIVMVQRLVRPPSNGLAFLLMACGALGVAAGASVIVNSLGAPNPEAGMAGAIFIVMGAMFGGLGYVSRSTSPTFVVVIGTGGGDKRALTTQDEALADGVVAALERAVAERG